MADDEFLHQPKPGKLETFFVASWRLPSALVADTFKALTALISNIISMNEASAAATTNPKVILRSDTSSEY
jgi:hypothetical protein